MKQLLFCTFFFCLHVAFAQEDPSDSVAWPIVHVSQEELDAWDAQWDDDEEEEGEEIYRTSDQPGERGTDRRRNLGQQPSYAQVAGGQRTGCYCMDGQRRNERGRGACGGRGGVRYWIYRMPDGAEVLYPTARHRDHPADLNKLEVSNLSAYNEDQKAGKTITFRVNSLYEWASALAVCSIMALFFRHLYMNNNDIFHQLRHRR